MKVAEELRRIAFAKDEELTIYDKIIKNRTCNLVLLEDACKRYVSSNSSGNKSGEVAICDFTR